MVKKLEEDKAKKEDSEPLIEGKRNSPKEPFPEPKKVLAKQHIIEEKIVSKSSFVGQSSYNPLEKDIIEYEGNKYYKSPSITKLMASQELITNKSVRKTIPKIINDLIYELIYMKNNIMKIGKKYYIKKTSIK